MRSCLRKQTKARRQQGLRAPAAPVPCFDLSDLHWEAEQIQSSHRPGHKGPVRPAGSQERGRSAVDLTAAVFNLCLCLDGSDGRKTGGREAVWDSPNSSLALGIVREQVGGYEGNMAVRKEESRQCHVWAWVWHSLRWPSQEGGGLSSDIHSSPFNPPLSQSGFRLATVFAGPNAK